jgi:hypothetical protein
MSVLSSESMRMLSALMEALAEPRRRSYFKPPREIKLTSPSGEPFGTLVYDSSAMNYRLYTPVEVES